MNTFVLYILWIVISLVAQLAIIISTTVVLLLLMLLLTSLHLILMRCCEGMTELSPAGTITCDDFITDMGAMRGRSGQLVPSTEGKIVRPGTGEDLPPNQEGELLIRGPQVMKGAVSH